MSLSELLNKQQIICNIPADISRDDIFRKLIAPLVDNGIVTDAEAFLEAVIERENDMTTQTPEGIAVPHAYSDSVRKLGISVGVISNPGMEFNEFEPNKCNVVFLIAIPGETPGAHLPILSSIAKILMTNQINEIIAAKTPEEVLKAL